MNADTKLIKATNAPSYVKMSTKPTLNNLVASSAETTALHYNKCLDLLVNWQEKAYYRHASKKYYSNIPHTAICVLKYFNIVFIL